MPGFGLLKKLKSKKTLGRSRGSRRRLQEGNEEEEFMGFGFIDSLIEMRFDITDTTGFFGDRWKSGESMIGKFLNKQPETWPPEGIEQETGGMSRGRSNLARERRELQAERQRLQKERESLAGGTYGRVPTPAPGEEQMGIDFEM